MHVVHLGIAMISGVYRSMYSTGWTDAYGELHRGGPVLSQEILSFKNLKTIKQISSRRKGQWLNYVNRMGVHSLPQLWYHFQLYCMCTIYKFIWRLQVMYSIGGLLSQPVLKNVCACVKKCFVWVWVARVNIIYLSTYSHNNCSQLTFLHSTH